VLRGSASTTSAMPGERLDQVEARRLHGGDHHLGDLAVVDGVGQVVAGRGRGQVDAR
jgi:hypothetical protein